MDLEAQRALRRLRRETGTKTQLIVASIREWQTLFRVAGCDVFTAPCSVLARIPVLMLAPYFKRALAAGQESWRDVVALAARHGIPIPGFGSALSYFDGYRSARLPANLLQAQRDYFGAHTYERVDAPRGKFFHLDWPDPKRSQRPV